MVDLPFDWRTPETARHIFRKAWCEREGLSVAVCDHPATIDRKPPASLRADRAEWCGKHHISDPAVCEAHFIDLDRRFASAWDEERGATLANLPKLDLTGRDLRHSFAPGAALTGAILVDSRMDGANLIEARLEGANLSQATLTGSTFIETRSEGATFDGARLERANFGLAWLEGATFNDAQLQDASFIGARLEGATFRGAALQRAYFGGAHLGRAVLNNVTAQGSSFFEAQLDGADLRESDFRFAQWQEATSTAALAHSSDFRGALNLTQSLLDAFIGNDTTLLPEGLHVWSCWEAPPIGFEALIETAIDPMLDSDFMRQSLRDESICNPENPRRPSGTQLSVEVRYPDGHPPAQADAATED
jgi:uncharacterized protein YjbI with pentapeptide repeats